MRKLGLMCVVAVFADGCVSWPGGSRIVVPPPDMTIAVDRVIEDRVVGQKPDTSTGQFSAAMRFRPLGPGKIDSQIGNGMLFAWGSGWYDGFAALQQHDDNTVAFRLGRSKTRSGFTVRSKNKALMGALNDLVCTYDGKTMRLYLNGVEAGTAEFADGISPNDETLNVGFNEYGVGSLKMFADKLEYWTHALTARQVAARFRDFPPQEKKLQKQLAELSVPPAGLTDLDVPVKAMALLDSLPIDDSAKRKNRRHLWQRRIHDNKLEEAFPQTCEMARELLAEDIPAEESTKSETPRVAIYLAVIDALQATEDDLRVDDDCRRQARELTGQLRRAFAKYEGLRQKIDQLQEEMIARGEALETKSLAHARKTFDVAGEQDGKVMIHLSPCGNDANDGSADTPLATLKAALDKARKVLEKGTSVIVEVADGIYFCAETAGWDGDGVTPGMSAPTLLVRPAKGAAPRFTGAVELTAFGPLCAPAVLERLDGTVRDRILVCDLTAAGVTDLGTIGFRGYPARDERHPWVDLYVNGEAMTLARWPNDGDPELTIIVPETEEGTAPPVLDYTTDRPNRWKLSGNIADDDIWAVGFWNWVYASQNRQIIEIDRSKKRLTVDYPGALRSELHARRDLPYYFRNIFEELDVPGEFYLDRRSGLLYLYPPEGVSPRDIGRSATVELSVSDGPLVMLRGMQNVAFEGLVFAGMRGSAVWVEDCENVYFRRCEITQAGTHGALFLGGRFCGVLDSHLHQLGGCGVRLSGGDRMTLDPAGHIVTNCQINDFCRVDRAYAQGVHTRGCGMTITHNLVYDSPHSAFRPDGNDMYVAFNEVHSVTYEYDDQSAIDVYCDPTYRGIVMRNNFWHHVGTSMGHCGQAGIRLDDSISGVVMINNIFYRSAGGGFGAIQIHGGKDNLVRHNVFVRCRAALSFSTWGNSRYIDRFIKNSSFNKTIEPYQALGVYPFMDEIAENLYRNYVLDNLVINCERFALRFNPWQLCARNVMRSVKPLSTEPDEVSTPQATRAWLMKLLDERQVRVLEGCGLKVSPFFPSGQANIPHRVAPEYSRE